MPAAVRERIITALSTMAPRHISSSGAYSAKKKIDCPMEKALGLRVSEEALIVREIHAGGWIAGWNNEHPEQAVLPGDSIVSVNGLQGDVPSMLMMLKMQPTSRHKPLSVVFHVEDAADTNLLEYFAVGNQLWA